MTPGQWLLAYDPNNVKPGWIAFGVVMALIVATFFLWRSMNTQLGRIRVPHRASFDADATGSSEPGDDGPGDTDPVAEDDGDAR